MADTLIVGGGLAGLVIAKTLQGRGFRVTLLEREPKLGGRAGVGHQRVYTEEARDLLKEICLDIHWERIEEDPIQLRKGEAGPVGDDLEAAERFYLGRVFYQPNAPFHRLVDGLLPGKNDAVHLRKTVTEVSLEKRQVTCLSGETFDYDRLIWTSTLASLLKACGKTPTGLSAGSSKKKEAVEFASGGLTWDIVTEKPLFENRNTVVFPFRYKDARLRALGVRGPAPAEGEHATHWMLFLEDSLLENREELAKVVRTFKREVGKQFPALETPPKSERLVFHPVLSEKPPVPATSLEVFEGVVCVGPDVQTESVSPTSERSQARNLDAVLLNCLDFVDVILPGWVASPPAPSPTTPEVESVNAPPVA